MTNKQRDWARAAVFLVIGIAGARVYMLATSPLAGPGSISVSQTDAGTTHVAGPGLILKSGMPFAPSTPSIVTGPMTMDGKWDYAEPAYLVKFKECVKHPEGTDVWVCCAGGFNGSYDACVSNK